jgi:hypothetical protein
MLNYHTAYGETSLRGVIESDTELQLFARAIDAQLYQNPDDPNEQYGWLHKVLADGSTVLVEFRIGTYVAHNVRMESEADRAASERLVTENSRY